MRSFVQRVTEASRLQGFLKAHFFNAVIPSECEGSPASGNYVDSALIMQASAVL